MKAKAEVRSIEHEALPGTRSVRVNREVTLGRLSPQYPDKSFESITIVRLGEPVAWARTRGKNRYTPARQRSAKE